MSPVAVWLKRDQGGTYWSNLALMKLIHEVHKWLLPLHTFLLALIAHRARAVCCSLTETQTWWRCRWGQKTENLKLTCWNTSYYIWKIPSLLCITPSKSSVLFEAERLLFVLMVIKPVLQFNSQNWVWGSMYTVCVQTVHKPFETGSPELFTVYTIRNFSFSV